MDDGENRRSISVQHDAIRVVMMRMHTIGCPVTAARRMSDGVHAAWQTSSESAVDGIRAKVDAAENHPSATLRGEASEGANGGAAG